VQVVLSRLIATEQRHVAFWQEFFGLQAERLNFSRRLKLAFCVFLRRMFGTGITYLILEAIEIYGRLPYTEGLGIETPALAMAGRDPYLI
jgi:hypothetical protein